MMRLSETGRAGPSRRATVGRTIEALAAIAAVAFFVWNIARFFPNARGGLGYDYGLFVPWLLAGFFWQVTNGVLSPAENLPSFCGGVPFVFNPQSIYYSVPQWLMTVAPPVQSLLMSWVTFGLVGGGCMYALLRRVFGVSSPAALLGAVIFLLNGFYTDRMIIGHATYHGIMLLPAFALTISPAKDTPPQAPLRWVQITARAVLLGLLISYLFYSGGTNIMIPMALTIVILVVLAGYLDRWNRDGIIIGVVGCILGIALSGYKLLPSLAFAANVTRPIALRMTSDLFSLVGGAVVSLFAPQVLSHLDPDRLIVDRVELEYGVGVVPLLVILAAVGVAFSRRHLWGATGLLLSRRRLPLVSAAAFLLLIPIFVNYDAIGLRWLMLHTPIIKSMSVMLRFWAVYIPVLSVLTALLLDYLIADPLARTGWSATAVALTILQCGATDMRYYANQTYDPGPVTTAYAAVRAGAPVPPITRIGDPWTGPGQRIPPYTARNDALVEGISDYPCYEPMFGYQLQVFKLGRLAPGPVMAVQAGLLDLKNPACYVFPAANKCQPGDEFTVAQTDEAAAFVAYRPYPYAWPLWQRVAAVVTLATGAGCLIVLLLAGAYLYLGRKAPTT